MPRQRPHGLWGRGRGRGPSTDVPGAAVSAPVRPGNALKAPAAEVLHLRTLPVPGVVVVTLLCFEYLMFALIMLNTICLGMQVRPLGQGPRTRPPGQGPGTGAWAAQWRGPRLDSHSVPAIVLRCPLGQGKWSRGGLGARHAAVYEGGDSGAHGAATLGRRLLEVGPVGSPKGLLSSSCCCASGWWGWLECWLQSQEKWV